MPDYWFWPLYVGSVCCPFLEDPPLALPGSLIHSFIHSFFTLILEHTNSDPLSIRFPKHQLTVISLLNSVFHFSNAYLAFKICCVELLVSCGLYFFPHRYHCRLLSAAMISCIPHSPCVVPILGTQEMFIKLVLIPFACPRA